VDLSLTLSQASIYQSIQKSLQQIGYFQRPLSAAIYLTVIILMFLYYFYFLYLAFKKKLRKKDFVILTAVTGLILTFSYNAFSYDIFNYIFDAKIITFYKENPYFHKALDYPGDPMLSFMRWTHRTYPYGPIWLFLTTPLSVIGLNVFLPTFFLFKSLATLSYFGAVYLIYKINQKVNPDFSLFNAVLFALNPLVIVESLVSSHNDIVMIFFALLGIYLYLLNKKIAGIILVVLSALVKKPTIVLLFPMILNMIPFKKYQLPQSHLFKSFVILSLGGLIYSLTQLEIQPWYFLWVLPFVALLKPNKYIIVASIGFSLGLLLRYLPFLYFGTWDGIVLPMRNYLTVFSIILPLIPVVILDFVRKG
jgi:hypothetical protein